MTNHKSSPMSFLVDRLVTLAQENVQLEQENQQLKEYIEYIKYEYERVVKSMRRKLHEQV